MEFYLPVLIFLGLGGGLAFVLLGLSWIRSPHRPYVEKNKTYECGFDALDAPDPHASLPFNVHFYIVAILFIIFDVEMAFLIPWGMALRTLSPLEFYSGLFFLGVLTAGFVYEWKKGALRWP